MQKYKPHQTSSKIILFALFFVIGLLSLNIHLNCYAEEGITFQKLASQVLNEEPGDDNSGNVYTWGLSARYSGSKGLIPGEGKFKNLFNFLPSIKWYDPAHYYQSPDMLQGEFGGQECVLCHTVQTPGIVKDWKRSRHSQPGKTSSMEKEEVVTCNRCHGSDHTKLKMPDINVCGECHMDKVVQHKSGGKGSHGNAFHLEILENGEIIDKPAGETHGCAACHGIIENRCDGCHSRHLFRPSEARRSENCGICHMGPEHSEYNAWSSSYHGKIYSAQSDEWDWNRSLKDWGKREKEGQLPAPRTPTCAFCHMPRGTHNVQKALTVDSDSGMSLVDRGAEQYAAKRTAWVRTCQTCHSPRFARDQLETMDNQIKISFTKVREAFKIVLDLKKEGLLDPMPEGLAPDWLGHNAFSLLPKGQARFYNISNLEKLALEMLANHTSSIYKSASHFSMNNITYDNGFLSMDRALVEIKSEASKLKRLVRLEEKAGIDHIPYDFWKNGEFTDLLKGKSRKEGDVLSNTECLHDNVKCLDETE